MDDASNVFDYIVLGSNISNLWNMAITNMIMFNMTEMELITNIMVLIYLITQTYCVCLFVFVALRPMSTAMVIAGRSVHLTTLFPGQA